MIHVHVEVVLDFIHDRTTFVITMDPLDDKPCTVAFSKNHIECAVVFFRGLAVDWHQASKFDGAINCCQHAFLIDEHGVHC